MNTKRAELDGEDLLHVCGMPATGIPLCFVGDIPEHGPGFAFATVGNEFYVDAPQEKPWPWSAERTTVERLFLVQDDPARPGGRGCTVESARARGGVRGPSTEGPRRQGQASRLHFTVAD